jgi:hypothetical protein
MMNFFMKCVQHVIYNVKHAIKLIIIAQVAKEIENRFRNAYVLQQLMKIFTHLIVPLVIINALIVF